MWLLNKSQAKQSSRKQIAIKEVKENILSLPDNQHRIILEASAINFELKSEAEQDVLIDTFQSFLHSLPCPLQRVIRVRELDINHYTDQLREQSKHETDKIYQEQIDDYCQFMHQLVVVINYVS